MLVGIATILGAILGMVVTVILTLALQKGLPNFADIAMLAIGSIFGITLVTSFQIPCVIKSGAEKGRIQMFIIIAVVAFGLGGLISLGEHLGLFSDGFLYGNLLEIVAPFLLIFLIAIIYTISYRVVNCADYGVPQTRKRFICVGVKGGVAFDLPEPTHNQNGDDGKLPWVTCGEVMSDFDNITEEEKLQRPGGKDYELLLDIPAGDNYLYYTDKRGYPNPKFKWKSRYWTFLLKLSPDRPSWTIQASHSQNQGPFHWRNRFLRIEELKRIQTFPDSYNLSGDFKEKWRQVGNAVPPLFAKILATKIKEDIFNG